MAPYDTVAKDLPCDPPLSLMSPKRALARSVIASAVGVGGEFALAIALMPFV